MPSRGSRSLSALSGACVSKSPPAAPPLRAGKGGVKGNDNARVFSRERTMGARAEGRKSGVRRTGREGRGGRGGPRRGRAARVRARSKMVRRRRGTAGTRPRKRRRGWTRVAENGWGAETWWIDPCLACALAMMTRYRTCCGRCRARRVGKAQCRRGHGLDGGAQPLPRIGKSERARTSTMAGRATRTR